MAKLRVKGYGVIPTENAFVLLAHKDQNYLEKIKKKLKKQDGVVAIDIEDQTAIQAFTTGKLSMYSMRLPSLRPLYPYAVLFRCPNATTLIGDIMDELADIFTKSSEDGIVCVIPESHFQTLQKKKIEPQQEILSLRKMLNEKYIVFLPSAKDKWSLLDNLTKLAYDFDFIENTDAFIQAVKKRETIQSTGIGENIAIPHVRCEAVKKPFVIIAITKNGVNFDSIDGEVAKIIILIGVIPEGPSHLPIMSQITTFLMNQEEREILLKCKNASEVMKVFHL